MKTFSDAVMSAIAGVVIAGGAYASVPGSGEGAPGSSCPKSSAIQVREVRFEHDGTMLAGTLYLPKGVRNPPIAIALHGASEPLRTDAVYRHLSERLPGLGMGVLLYDRRGHGGSGSSAQEASYDLLAGDAQSGKSMINRLPGLERSRVGYWGFSQGGWLAMLAGASDPTAAFVISVSAPLVTPDIQMIHAVSNILRIRGFDEEAVRKAVRARMAVDQYALGKLTQAQAQSMLDQVAGEPWFKYTYLNKTISAKGAANWAKEMSHDPLDILAGVRAPVLLFYGLQDPWIPVAESLQRLNKLKNGAEIATVVVAEADHSMMIGVPDIDKVETSKFVSHAPNSKSYFGALTGWLRERSGMCR